MFQVDFDPAVVSFAKLLDVFWAEHDPCAGSWSTQYKTILFYADDGQRRVAESSAAKVAKRLGRPVRTELRKLERFFLAEDYHQKYALRRHRKLTADLKKLFPTETAFVDSTAAARVNAHLDGHLSLAELRSELAKLGLRAVGTRQLEGVERAKPEPVRGSPAARR